MSTAESIQQEDLYDIAERVLPGAGLGGYSLARDVRFIIARGEGARVQSTNGRWYLDYVGGAGANILGHCHPRVVEAVKRQAARGLHYFGTLNDSAVELSAKLVERIPCAEKIILTTTGSEATFYAMRIARAYSGKTKILKFEGGYHGNHDYSSFALFPSGPANYPVGTADSGGVPDVLQRTVLVAPYNDLDTARRIVEENREELAAIIVEPVQRIIFPQPGFLEGLRTLCDEFGILLILDEVVTGFRLALGGAQECFGVRPDLASYGKIVGGGGPLGCVAGRADIIEHTNPNKKGQPDYAYINGTLHGNPIAAAAGLATLEELERPGFYERLGTISMDLKATLQEVLDHHGLPAIVSSRYSFWQILFMAEEPKNQLEIVNSDQAAMRKLDNELLRQGIYVLPGVRRFVSAVNTREDIAQTAEALDRACRAL